MLQCMSFCGPSNNFACPLPLFSWALDKNLGITPEGGNTVEVVCYVY